MNDVAIAPGDSRLAERLRHEIRGAVLFDRADRGRYATDASIYQVEPIGVIVPEEIGDVAAALAIAREEGVPVLPRGGGTSQCGQTVNRALVIDCSKHLRRILHIDPDARTALVEPGVVLGHLNAALRQHGLFFPVDPSTHARCTIGGMAGNNSCGSKSIRYGLMADNVRAIDAILADGTQHKFGLLPDNIGADVPTGIADLIQRLRALGASEAEEIAARFPSQLRRVGGYNIDVLTPVARLAGQENLARLLVGSEGTLAFSAAIELALHPIKPRKLLGICQFPTFRHAMQAAQHIVELDPEAVELVDRTMIDLGRGIPIYRATIDRMLIGEPDSLLIVEFHGHDDAPLITKLDQLDELMSDLGHPDAVVRAADAGFQADIAAVREAGLNIMMSMKGDGKPVSFIEDCAVDLEDLADYTERLNDVFARHDTKGTWYAHASVGCLHVRPVLNMKDPHDVATMRAVAEECFALVREYKGSHSGEHGDGLVRSEFHETMFGSRIVRAFETVKDAFDPSNMLNPGRIVRPPRMDDRTLFRYGPGYAAVTDFTPKLDWSEHPGPLGRHARRGGDVQQQRHLPRVRCRRDVPVVPRDARRNASDARARQHAATGADRTARRGRDGVGCGGRCDGAVRIVQGVQTRMPDRRGHGEDEDRGAGGAVRPQGLTRRDWLIAELPRYAPLVAPLAPLANLRNRVPALRRLGERMLGLAADRPLPAWRRDAFRDREAACVRPVAPARRSDAAGRHVQSLVRTGESARRTARADRGGISRAHAGRIAGGRCAAAAASSPPAWWTRRAARRWRTLDILGSGELPVIGLEPSCLLTLA